MEHRIAIILSNFLLTNKFISQEQYEIYVYGNELLLSFLFSTSIILVIGLLLKRFFQTILFLLIFILVRRCTGGYHANTYFKCKLTTVMTYLSVLGLSEYTSIEKIHYKILLAIGLSIIISIGPIENPNKPLSVSQRKRNKLMGAVLFTIILILGEILSDRQSMLGGSTFYSLLSIIILMVIAKILIYFYKKEVTTNEKNM